MSAKLRVAYREVLKRDPSAAETDFHLRLGGPWSVSSGNDQLFRASLATFDKYQREYGDIVRIVWKAWVEIPQWVPDQDWTRQHVDELKRRALTEASLRTAVTILTVQWSLDGSFKADTLAQPDLRPGLYDADGPVFRAALAALSNGKAQGINGLTDWLKKDQTVGLHVAAAKQDVPRLLREAPKEALEAAFSDEIQRWKTLKDFLRDESQPPFKAALNDMRAGQGGWGAAGIKRWIAQSSVKTYYRDQLGIGTHIDAAEKQAAENAARIRAEQEAREKVADTLNVNSMLSAGQQLISQNGQYKAVYQADGNFVVYGPQGAAVWSTETNGKPSTKLAMQGDGNLVIYQNNTPVWDSKTGGKGSARLVMQSDGNLVIYQDGGKPIWNMRREVACAAESSVIYAYDGTLTNEEHRSAIWQVYTRFEGINSCPAPTKGMYIHGPNGFGNDSEDLFFKLFNYACEEVKRLDIKKVFVIGFSRGAINAIRFANDFPGCTGRKRVFFIGISDPVDALMVGAYYNDHKELLPERGAHSYRIVKYKNDGLDFWFSTRDTGGFPDPDRLSNAEQNSDYQSNEVRHWTMNASTCVSGREVERRLIKQMEGLGASFSKRQLPVGPERCKI